MTPDEPDDFWPPTLPSKAQLAAIGRVTVEWAYLETKIDESIWLLLGRPQTKQFNRNIDIQFDRRMRFWKDLLQKVSQTERAIQELDSIIDRARNLNGLRDLIVHGRWGTNYNKKPLTGVIAWRFTPDFKMKFHPISTKMVDALPDKIRKLTDHLYKFEQKHIFPIP